jgi:hypothetical protein
MPGDPPGKRYYDIVISLSDHSFQGGRFAVLPRAQRPDRPVHPAHRHPAVLELRPAVPPGGAVADMLIAVLAEKA